MLLVHTIKGTSTSKDLIPESVYQFNLAMFFKTDGDVDIATFLPLENGRQEILDETIVAKTLDIEDKSSIEGRYVKWRGNQESQQINYRSLLSLRASKYVISHELEIPESYNAEQQLYLKETPTIPIHHEEIEQLWNSIKPTDDNSTYQVLTAIYNFTYKEISPLPFKGVTDSLTALRLKAASCNGKSRLFLSLARLNNLPSRLVGGIILNGKKKKTSHQWLEVYIEDHWVPFDVTNGHFASLPKHYLELYRGDHQLFKHSANINFDYYFTSSREYIAPALYRDIEIDNTVIPNAAHLLQDLGLPLKTVSIFLLFPLCTLVITFLKNIIGIKTFGTFMPMLIAAVCMYTGFIVGLIGFSVVLIFAFIGHTILGKFHILKIPRLASIITLISIVSLLSVSLINAPIGIETGILAIFPAVIISFTADRIHQMSDENDWVELFQNSAGTLLTIYLCYLCFTSVLLQGLFAIYPELLLLVLAILLHIGSWSGMRISEIIRFKNLLKLQGEQVLGLNGRNRNLIYKHNDKTLLKLAADKLQSKIALNNEHIPCPSTWASCTNHAGIEQFLTTIENKHNFVIKPNKGSRGNGILILTGQTKNGFLSTSGKVWSIKEIKRHVAEILSGSFSQSGEEDQAFIEPMIQQHQALKSITPQGLCDIRLIICNGKLISAMLRVPTLASSGKANLHQGAVGVSIDINTGTIERAVINGVEISHHPDSHAAFKGISIPFWSAIKDISLQCYIAIPLGYMGVDICLDEQRGPLVLEVNGRPGLEIQNVQNTGMKVQLSAAF